MQFDKIKTEYGKSLVILTSGTFIAQLIPIALYPIVSRLFSPEQFGSLSVMTQITNILSIIAPGGYLYAIFVCKKKKTALNLLFFSIVLSTAVLFIFTLLLLFGRYHLSKLLSEPLLIHFFYIPAIMAFCIIIFQSYNEWCVRNKQFKQLSINKSLNSGFISCSELSIGIANPNLFNNGLVIGDVIGRILSALSCLISIFGKEHHLVKFLNIREFRKVACEFSRFPQYIMPAKLVNTVARSIPVFFISAAFTKEQLGFFSMANMILVIPVSVISIAVSDGFRQRAYISYTKNGSCKDILIRTIKPLTIISLVGFSVLFLIAPNLFEIVLGNNWTEAGVYARFLIPIVLIEFVSEVVKPVFIIANKQHYDLIWQLLFLVSMLILICIKYADMYHFLIIFSVTKALLFLLQFLICYKLSNGKKTYYEK